MAYVTQADLVERFGVSKLAQLTDETAAQSADSAEILKACDEASSLIDSYIGARYAVPLSPVPTMVRKWAADIAWKFLCKDRAQKDSVATLNHDTALAQLKDVARGVAALPDATGTLPTQTGGIRYTVPNAVFDTTGLL